MAFAPKGRGEGAPDAARGKGLKRGKPHLAAKKTTSKKTTKTASRGQTARRPAEPERVLSRAAWGAVWAVLGLLCLLSILPIDGVLLVWLHRGAGAVIGMGSYALPFALLALAGLLFTRDKGPVRLRGACILLLPVLLGGIVHAFTLRE